METDEEQGGVVPFQLQFDKPIASQIKIAEWNPEKDLLAMVTEDSKLLLHRFNWQRLWTVSPGKNITSICWRPDGKAIAVGLEDGTISLHDVENGKLLRNIKSHSADVVCLHWEEDGKKDKSSNTTSYEDRTSRFFPPPPRVPKMPGLVPGDSGFMDDGEDSFQELSNSSHQRYNILCSGDKDGSICFNIFGIFPIGTVNIHNLVVSSSPSSSNAASRLLNASICKVALSKDLCHLVVLCNGELITDEVNQGVGHHGLLGFHCLVLNTSIFSKRKTELHQVAQQASNIEDLSEVIRTSLSVMSKIWSDAMHTFHEKFNAVSTLIIDHGLDSTPQDEFLSLLGGARASPPLHQFLENSLGEAGLKRVAKAVNGAGKELQLIVLDHLQPAAEIIGFRIGELRGLSKWRARYKGIGLDEKLMDNATERAGMLFVQVERFMRVLASVVQQFSNFFSWLLKSVKILMAEPSDQLPFNSELVIIFLKFLYDQDPVRQLLELSKVDRSVEVDMETMQRIKQLEHFGGFSDLEYLKRTLSQEFQQMEACFKDAFEMPFSAISEKLLCKDLLPLFPIASSSKLKPYKVPASVSYYEDISHDSSESEIHQQTLTGYISFKLPDDSFPVTNYIGIIRGLTHDLGKADGIRDPIEAALLRIPDGHHCMDLSLYKEGQIVLLLNETATTSENSGNGYMMILQAGDLPFVSLSRSTAPNSWKLHELQDSAIYLQLESEKVRSIPHSVVSPLAVSASRGVACVFAARKRALVYILDEDEDEDEVSDTE
ncbi:Anaphase-promoting complex subunit 4 [Capsicum annuum]|uniref:anaphase-promoting complex subunit 4 isoform X5 n=1 Tax=Capsicum annuum TaxID=4072 RepID=UPI001FB0900E|nr:anaphase-promoting complex subunit 4 isoform X5 [Capsicum annuum]KAF3629101.1 Anaphase-promoting complex subunit 4 [Capsicum annuum]KAF3630235.1 Anaphase-promoting complex subunit 4 [Capsicum annuum]